MRKGILILISIALLLCLSSCMTTGPETAAHDAEYSLNTLLIAVEDKTDIEAVNAILDKYNATIIYDYDNFMMYAVGLDHTYTPYELEELISALEKEELIISVNKDYIYTINMI